MDRALTRVIQPHSLSRDKTQRLSTVCRSTVNVLEYVLVGFALGVVGRSYLSIIDPFLPYGMPSDCLTA
ncbi:hypothetical protein BDV09DRAFT_172213 [Aspergillus tetrazonus]